MFADFERDPLPATLACDLCIVGAGAAGIALALRLAGRGVDVLLVEGGGLAPDRAAQDLCRGDVVGPLPYRPLERSRFRVFGGATTQWGGVGAPFSDIDFEARAWVPWSGWPLARRDLDPYYAEANALLDLGRCDYGAPATARAAGRLLPLPADGPFGHFAFRRGLHPTRFADDRRAALARAGDVRVLLRANAIELEPDAAGRRIEGLRIASLGGRRARVEARAFALALGGLETPRLLLNSDRAAPGGVGNGRDLVGRFFMDHLAVNAGRVRGLPAAVAAAYMRHPDADGAALVVPAVALDPGLQRAERVSHVCATLGPVNVVRARSRGFWAARMAASSSARTTSARRAWRRRRTGAWSIPTSACSGSTTSIASAGVFPTGGCVNPTLTIVALALRLADHLRARLGDAGPRRPAAPPRRPGAAPTAASGVAADTDDRPVPPIAARVAAGA